jgi:hypothetical protein
MKTKIFTSEEPEFSFWEKLASNAGIVKLKVIYDRIRTGYYALAIKALRDAFAQGKTLLGDKLKKRLDAFTVSGIFSPARRGEDLQAYTGLICLDFDHLPPGRLSELKAKAAAMPETIMVFISPRGEGLKVIVWPKTDWPLTLENHTRTYIDAGERYQKTLGFPYDPSCKDVTRLCLMAHVPEIFFDPSRVEGSGVRGRRKGYRRIGV